MTIRWLQSSLWFPETSSEFGASLAEESENVQPVTVRTPYPLRLRTYGIEQEDAFGSHSIVRLLLKLRHMEHVSRHFKNLNGEISRHCIILEFKKSYLNPVYRTVAQRTNPTVC